MAQKHLWEIDHPYYAAEGPIEQYMSWSKFLEECDDMDDDYNLLYRWDIPQNKTGPIQCADPYYRAYTIVMTYIMQRKSQFFVCEVQFCQKDEPAIITFLQQKWAYLKQNWEGISDLKESEA